MKLHRLTITNFGSFRGEQTFQFPDKPGLYFMQGINEAEPRLEANGSGKTTIWRALSWLLFGKDPRGLKAGDVCNWDAGKGSSVELAYELDGAVSLAIMKRTWAPNSWTLTDLFGNTTDLTAGESNPVFATLNLAFTPFLNCILMAQGQPMFLDLERTQQASLFSDVMGLDRWLKYSEHASAKAKTQDAISRKLEKELAAHVALFAQIQGQDLKEHISGWKDAQNRALDGIEAGYEKALTKLEALKDTTKILEAKQKESQDFVTKASRVCEAALKLERDRLRDVRDCELRLAELDGQHAALSKNQKSTASGKCPTCGQRIANNHSHDESTRSIQELAAKIKSEEKLLDVAEAGYDRALLDFDQADKDLRKCEAYLADHSTALKNHVRSIQLVERELDVLEEKAEDWHKQKNPYAELQELQLKEGDRLQALIESTQRLLDDSNSQYSLLTFWVRGFKEVRLQLIAEALNELEIEVNNCVMALGLVDWELNFCVDRETKGGSIQKGFSVVVRSPVNAAPVPWEAWSGGEAQRLRIAASMGLANLIRNRTGTQMNLEVWDEPSAGLSPQGIKDLLESLAARAETESQQIWIVDHQSHSFGGFTGGAVITKTAKGSSLKQY